MGWVRAGQQKGRLCPAIIVTSINTFCDHIEKDVHIIQKSCNARAADTVADEAPIAVARDKSAVQQASQVVGDVGLR